MSQPVSPYEANPPSVKRLVVSVGIAIGVAVVVLVAFVLPAEYGIDPIGIGRVTGLAAMHAPKKSLEVKDVIGGNEAYRKVEITDPGKPTPLPNPAVIQLKQALARTDTVTVKLAPGDETEVKAIMDAAQVIIYSWKAEGGQVYTDFHGHEPDAGEAFVRYEEQMSGAQGQGSLVAPFSGEHGWYWVNVSDNPVTITLHVDGYHKDIKNYGLLRQQ